MHVDLGSIQSLSDIGFEGFLTTKRLHELSCSPVPKLCGVYIVVRDSVADPSFLEVSPAGRFKGRDPSLPMAELLANWVPKAPVLYIGKAGGSGSSATLRSRLTAYMRFGAGRPVGHWGGRLIWQLGDSSDLRICWKATGDHEPREIEKQLIHAFITARGTRPFANLTG